MFIATVDTFTNKSGDFMTKTSKFNLVIALNAFKGPERSDITFSLRAVTKVLSRSYSMERSLSNISGINFDRISGINIL